MKHLGYNNHRLKENDPYHKDEVAIVKEINEMIEMNPEMIGQILNTDNYYVSEEQEKDVISTLQWLGTPVGKSFINKIYNTEIF